MLIKLIYLVAKKCMSTYHSKRFDRRKRLEKEKKEEFRLWTHEALTGVKCKWVFVCEMFIWLFGGNDLMNTLYFIWTSTHRIYSNHTTNFILNIFFFVDTFILFLDKIVVLSIKNSTIFFYCCLARPTSIAKCEKDNLNLAANWYIFIQTLCVCIYCSRCRLDDEDRLITCTDLSSLFCTFIFFHCQSIQRIYGGTENVTEI